MNATKQLERDLHEHAKMRLLQWTLDVISTHETADLGTSGGLSTAASLLTNQLGVVLALGFPGMDELTISSLIVSTIRRSKALLDGDSEYREMIRKAARDKS